MKENYWDKLMGTDEEAGRYMSTYGEGPGTETRDALGLAVDSGDSLLDVGCGPGWNMDHFAQIGPTLRCYKGVDYAIRFVRAANKRRKEEHTQDYTAMQIVPFEQQDCRDLKETDGSWDVVLIQDCLEHTNGYEKPVEEGLRVARKRVVTTFWHLTENDDHINEDGDDGFGAWYSKGKWEEFLDTLPYHWSHYDITDKAGKKRDYYVINKEMPK